MFSEARVAAQVARMARAISRDYAGKRLDVVILLESAFIFGADLVRRIACPTVCHFVRVEQRDIRLGGYERREIFFSNEPELEGRDVLVVDTLLQSGVTLDFLVKRLQATRPRSLRVAVLLDRPRERRVSLQADYVGLCAASKYVVGYGLPGRQGLYRNLPYVGTLARRTAGKRLRRARQRKDWKR